VIWLEGCLGVWAIDELTLQLKVNGSERNQLVGLIGDRWWLKASTGDNNNGEQRPTIVWHCNGWSVSSVGCSRVMVAVKCGSERR